MDHLETLVDQFNGTVKNLRQDLRISKRELHTRFDNQDKVLLETNQQVNKMNSVIQLHEVEITKLQTNGQTSIHPLTRVLLDWGRQKWFPWVTLFILGSAGGHAIKDWGDAIIKVLSAPKP